MDPYSYPGGPKPKDPTDPDPNNCLPVTRFGYIISDIGSNCSTGNALEAKFLDKILEWIVQD